MRSPSTELQTIWETRDYAKPLAFRCGGYCFHCGPSVAGLVDQEDFSTRSAWTYISGKGFGSRRLFAQVWSWMHKDFRHLLGQIQVRQIANCTLSELEIQEARFKTSVRVQHKKVANQERVFPTFTPRCQQDGGNPVGAECGSWIMGHLKLKILEVEMERCACDRNHCKDSCCLAVLFSLFCGIGYQLHGKGSGRTRFQLNDIDGVVRFLCPHLACAGQLHASLLCSQHVVHITS